VLVQGFIVEWTLGNRARPRVTPDRQEGQPGLRLLSCAFIFRCLTRAAELELQRLYTLDCIASDWHRRLGERRRSSRAPDALDRLLLRPATTVRGPQRDLGMTFQGAQLLVAELDRLGILRETTGRALDRVWVARSFLYGYGSRARA
jgi:hypothetical protein